YAIACSTTTGGGAASKRRVGTVSFRMALVLEKLVGPAIVGARPPTAGPVLDAHVAVAGACRRLPHEGGECERAQAESAHLGEERTPRQTDCRTLCQPAHFVKHARPPLDEKGNGTHRTHSYRPRPCPLRSARFYQSPSAAPGRSSRIACC